MASELIRNEVQVLRVASSAVNSSSDSIAGNFRLSWGDGGEETDYLPADVGEVELEAALEALVEVRDVQVGVVHGFEMQRNTMRYSPLFLISPNCARAWFLRLY